MYNGNVQQNPLPGSRQRECVEFCVIKDFSIPSWFSPTIFDPDANSDVLQTRLCTAVDSMRRKPCVRNCLREREGLYNGNVQQNPLCAASCHEESSHSSPVLTYDFLSRCKFSTPTSTPLYSSKINRLYAQNPVFEIVHDESVWYIYTYTTECLAEPSTRRILGD